MMQFFIEAVHRELGRWEAFACCIPTELRTDSSLNVDHPLFLEALGREQPTVVLATVEYFN